MEVDGGGGGVKRVEVDEGGVIEGFFTFASLASSP